MMTIMNRIDHNLLTVILKKHGPVMLILDNAHQKVTSSYVRASHEVFVHLYHSSIACFAYSLNRKNENKLHC